MSDWVPTGWQPDGWQPDDWQDGMGSGVGVGTPITNPNATTNVPKNYEICPVSGFRQYPAWDRLSKLRQRWDGQYVRADSLDMRHPQEYVKSGANRAWIGPQSPEPADNFIANSISPEDL